MLFVLVASCQQTVAQEHERVVQVSGVVTANDSTTGLEGVAVYVPGSARGTLTTIQGFFSLPTLAGDTIAFSALGYQTQRLLIPENYSEKSYRATVHLQATSTVLPTVDVIPWATEQDFEQAVLSLKLPSEPGIQLELGSPAYKSILHAPPMDAVGNSRYFQQQQTQQQQRTYIFPNIIRFLSIPIK
ncbi:MAG: carboxypeptidase-like regulatory domain-containing protein [Hymenobacteraceae bacterium]|nr:carboxypeptidase-like regulatory domain-containing protein [Hymenobacteraceae bacterium]